MMIRFIFKIALINRYFSIFFFWLKIRNCDTNHNTISKFYCAVAFWSSSKSRHSARAKFENSKFVKSDEKSCEFSLTNWFSIWFFQFSKIFKSNKFFDDTAFQSAIFFSAQTILRLFEYAIIDRFTNARLFSFQKIEKSNIHDICQRNRMNIAFFHFLKFFFSIVIFVRHEIIRFIEIHWSNFLIFSFVCSIKE